MHFINFGRFGLLLSLLVSSWAMANQPLTISDKALLQAAMQRHIDRHLVNGVYLQLNTETGDVRKLHPGAAHPMILQMGEYFVLCTDFLDAAGQSVNIDFYLAQQNQSYSVFQTIVDNRLPLDRWVKSGKAKRVN